MFVASYPRSGSTWLRFVLTEVLTGQPSTFPSVNRAIPQVGYHAQALRLPGGGRFIKTHESYRQEYRRAVCLVRDPRDTLLSEYAFQQALGLVHCDLDTYITQFLQGLVNGNGAWQVNVASWLDAAASNPEILVVRFEDLRRNPEDAVKSILDYLGAVVDPDSIRSSIQNNTADKMRAKELSTPQKSSKGGRFVRGGIVGGWRENLDENQLLRIERHAGDCMKRLRYQRSQDLALQERRTG